MAALNSSPNTNCSICCLIYIQPVVLRCGHTFCQDCLDRWLGRRRCCPICRMKVPVHHKPIVLSGWDDIMDSLALGLPEDEREERRATKRQREEDEISKTAKRSRTENGSSPGQIFGFEGAHEVILFGTTSEFLHGFIQEHEDEAEWQSEATDAEWEEDDHSEDDPDWTEDQ